MSIVNIENNLRELVAKNIILEEKIIEIQEMIDRLEKECRHFDRQFQMLMHHHEHVDSLVQSHEAAMCKMEMDDKED